MPTNGQDVKIAHYTRSKFNSLTNKDSATIYYVEETDGKIKQYIGNTHVVSDITDVVKLSGAQTIAGVKTFSSIPVLPASDPTSVNQAVRKSYVDSSLVSKVDTVIGKGLSTNDYTTTEKNKLAGIASGAQVNVQSNWNATSGAAFILNKPTIPTNNNQLTNGAGYITGYTETDPIFSAWNKSTGISITKSQVSDLINATQSLSGLMSSTDKTRLDVLHSLLEEDTANNVVDSINEVLAIFNNYPEGADLVTALLGKVDKVIGKGLSTNDYTTTEKNKLSGIATGAQVNVGTNLSQGARNTTTLRIDSSTGNNFTLPAVTTGLAGLMTSTDKVKLNGIATGAQVNRTIATTAQAQDGTDDTTVMTPLKVKESISELVDTVDELSGMIDYTNDLMQKKLVAGDNITIDEYNDYAVISASGGTWKQVNSGLSSSLSKTAYTTLTLNETAIYYDRPMMMEIRFGNNSTAYTSQIVTFNLGYSTSTTPSKTFPRTVSITDFDGRYLKTIAVTVYADTLETNLLTVGPVKTLIGDFVNPNSPGTLTWTTEASDSISVYVGKIWVME